MSARSGYAPTDDSTNLPQKTCQQIWPNGSFRYESFGAVEHIKALHPESSQHRNGVRKGVVSFAQRVSDGKKHWKEWTVPVGGDAVCEAERIVRNGTGEDIFISQQAFGRWRGVADLAAIGSHYVDLDYHKLKRWNGRKPQDVAAAVIFLLDEQELPLPSYILSTGRGLVCVWLTELLPPIVLPRWTLVQKTLANVLTKFGADKRALDAARVFRIAGSFNSRAEWSQRQVGLVWCQGSPEAPTRHVFGTLADEVLPHTQAEIISIRAERAARKAEHEGREKRITQKLTGYTLWSMIHDDLQKLRRYRNPETGALPPGGRDAWLFVAANALSWIVAAEDMEREIRILAMQAAGWSDSESKSRLSAIVQRGHQAAAGKSVLYNGREVDPRYRMRANTIIDWLQIEPAEMRDADLRVLVDAGIQRERASERQTEYRRRKGAVSREAQRAERLALGQKCLYMAAKSGMNRDDLAAHFSVSTGQISKAMAEARKSKK